MLLFLYNKNIKINRPIIEKYIFIWMKSAQHTFVLSPFGNGLDCHRTWEAICLGCIPIIKAPFFRTMFDGLPVLIVNDWREVNQQLLNETISNFKEINFNFDKINLSYWVNQIRLHKSE